MSQHAAATTRRARRASQPLWPSGPLSQTRCTCFIDHSLYSLASKAIGILKHILQAATRSALLTLYLPPPRARSTGRGANHTSPCTSPVLRLSPFAAQCTRRAPVRGRERKSGVRRSWLGRSRAGPSHPAERSQARTEASPERCRDQLAADRGDLYAEDGGRSREDVGRCRGDVVSHR